MTTTGEVAGFARLEPDDETLVAALRGGDHGAFEVLYRRHVGAVMQAVGDNVHDRETRLDVVQEVFTRALVKLPTLRDPTRFRPWLLQIARNAAIDERRARRAFTPDSIDALDTEIRSDEPGPGLEVEVRALADALSSGIATLSARDSAALSLAVHFGFGPREIAEALDITEGNAKVVLHRARRRLKAAIEQERLVEEGVA